MANKMDVLWTLWMLMTALQFMMPRVSQSSQCKKKRAAKGCRLSKNYWRLSLRRRPHAKCEGHVLTQTWTSRPLSNTEVAFPKLKHRPSWVTFQIKHECRTSLTANARVTFCAKRDSHTFPQNVSLHSSTFSTKHASLWAPRLNIRARSVSSARPIFLL